MALDFPNSPVNGATYTANDKSWQWDGTSWKAIYNQATANWGVARDITIGSTTKSVNGSANVSWTVGEIGAQPADPDLTSIAGLAGTSGLLRKTAANTWSLDTTAYLTGNQTITLSGDLAGSGSTTITTTLANSGVTAGTYTKVTVDAKGRVTTGATLASADLPTYTGTITSSQVTTALGFTPYNSTNPNGYITSTGSITGNAGTVTNGVYTTGDQTIAGTKTFSTAPVVGTAAEKTATTSAASTAFVDRLRSLATPTTGASGTLVVGDRGAFVDATGGITVPVSVFSARDVITIYNSGTGAITITQGASLIMRQAGTANTGNRTLAQYGLATIVFRSGTECIISGSGLT